MADIIQSYFQQHEALARQTVLELSPRIEQAGRTLCQSLAEGGKLMTFGNGGSASDAMHFAEEIIGRFQRTRRPLPAVCLNSDGPALTCIANDFGYENVFGRQVTALAQKGDVVVGISTSGNSENVLLGLRAAKAKSASTIALLGRGGGKIATEADLSLVVPQATAAHGVQEMHIVIIHLLCDIIDRWAAGEAEK
jgi:D-sedoheptulose 7-phosphate isomerase